MHVGYLMCWASVILHDGEKKPRRLENRSYTLERGAGGPVGDVKCGSAGPVTGKDPEKCVYIFTYL